MSLAVKFVVLTCLIVGVASQTVTLTSPTSSSRVRASATTIAWTSAGETTTAGTITLTNSTTSVVWTMDVTSYGPPSSYSFVVDTAAPTTSPAITAGSGVVAGVYNITMNLTFVSLATDASTAQDVTLDAVTLAPVIASPSGASPFVYQSTTIDVTVTFPELPDISSIHLKINNSDSPNLELTIDGTSITAGNPLTIMIDINDPTSSSLVTAISGGTTIPEGTDYVFTLRYQDLVGNDEASASYSFVVIDTFNEPFNVTSPETGSHVPAVMMLTWELPENYSNFVVTINDGTTNVAFIRFNLGLNLTYTYNWTWTSVASGPEVLLAAGTLVDGNNYTLTFEYRDVYSNLPVATVVVSDVTVDLSTVNSSFFEPLSSSVFGYNDVISFALGENPSRDPDTLNITNVVLSFVGDVTRTMVLLLDNSYSEGENVTFVLDPKDPSAAANVASISPPGSTIPDGTYSVSLSYQDALLNAANVQTKTNVVVDRTTQPPTLSSPVTGNTYNIIPIQFSLPETPLTNSTKVTFAGTINTTIVTLDVTQGSTRIYIAPDDDLYIDSAIVSGFPILNNDTYTVTLSYQDEHGNEVASTSVSNIVVLLGASGVLITDCNQTTSNNDTTSENNATCTASSSNNDEGTTILSSTHMLLFERILVLVGGLLLMAGVAQIGIAFEMYQIVARQEQRRGQTKKRQSVFYDELETETSHVTNDLASFLELSETNNSTYLSGTFTTFIGVGTLAAVWITTYDSSPNYWWSPWEYSIHVIATVLAFILFWAFFSLLFSLYTKAAYDPFVIALLIASIVVVCKGRPQTGVWLLIGTFVMLAMAHVGVRRNWPSKCIICFLTLGVLTITITTATL